LDALIVFVGSFSRFHFNRDFFWHKFRASHWPHPEQAERERLMKNTQQ